ncbi:MAG: Capsular glucan synthase [Candidatus Omnitrophica bacterium ADurb.Bin292]|jgi:glycosyltransferase involved in cell wall biosynthesis|nr:MAG: Capsular glucan synthase [Candidatus Omnitrophica bacterium ADurb.Bin292]HQB12565.1 glycosyltransferase family 4 protein [Candidatus Omnitrophota bacterium]
MPDRRYKIIFVSPHGTDDPKAASGTAYFFSRALNNYIGDVQSCGALRSRYMDTKDLRGLFSPWTWLYLFNKAEEIFWRVLGRKHPWYQTPSVAKYLAKKIEKKLETGDFDLLIADKASVEIAFLKTDLPIVYFSDATFHAMLDYYPSHINLSPRSCRFGEMFEAKALQRADVFVPYSRWAAESAVRDYGVAPEKIRRINFHVRYLEEAQSEVVPERTLDVCKLLFVGVDWERKGGDIAVEAMKLLNQMGVPSRLLVCGCPVPEEYRADSRIEEIGFLDKTSPQGKKRYQELFDSSSFFILPTRAECLGLVFADALASGLPVLATDTGGIPDVVEDGETGFLLPLSAEGREYAEKIKNVWLNRALYKKFENKSRERFKERFSTEIWKREMNAVIEQALKPRMPAR